MDRNQYSCVKALEGKAANKYSQWGEDGLLEVIFNIIGVTNKYVVEIGAADGLMFSNSRKLIEEGWNALLIEKEQAAYDRLVKNSNHLKFVTPLLAEVTSANIESLLLKNNVPIDLDFISIDIDGQDYYIWNSLINFKPRVLMIEFTPEDLDALPPSGGEGQAGMHIMKILAASKGYQPAAITYTNMICIEYNVCNQFQKQLESICD